MAPQRAGILGFKEVARRTRLAFLNINAAKTCLPNVVEIMGKELGWSGILQKQNALSFSR